MKTKNDPFGIYRREGRTDNGRETGMRGRRWAQAAALERLKERLVTKRLGPEPDEEAAVTLRRAATEAAGVAWMTRYPLLVLPELLKEKSDAALSHLQRQEAIHQQSKALLSLAA